MNNEMTEVLSMKSEALEGKLVTTEILKIRNQRELDIHLAGKEEGLIQGVNLAIERILPTVVAALIGEREKKAAISDGFRSGSSECAKVMSTHYRDKAVLKH